MDGAVSVSQWVKGSGGGSDKAASGDRCVVTSGTVTVTSINVQDHSQLDLREYRHSTGLTVKYIGS